ncbi:MAG: hypothetical protein AAGD06_04075 [Acidobacteriota bacterium]
MLVVVLAAVVTVSITVLIHATGTSLWLTHLKMLAERGRGEGRSGLVVLTHTG